MTGHAELHLDRIMGGLRRDERFTPDAWACTGIELRRSGGPVVHVVHDDVVVASLTSSVISLYPSPWVTRRVIEAVLDILEASGSHITLKMHSLNTPFREVYVGLHPTGLFVDITGGGESEAVTVLIERVHLGPFSDRWSASIVPGRRLDQPYLERRGR